MAGYADLEFYKTEYLGAELSDDVVNKALVQASRAIDEACHYRIQDFDKLTVFQQRQVKLATCAEAEYTAQYGELSDYLSVVGSYSIGDVSVSSGTNLGGGRSEQYNLSITAVRLLIPTGLLDRRLR